MSNTQVMGTCRFVEEDLDSDEDRIYIECETHGCSWHGPSYKVFSKVDAHYTEKNCYAY